MVVRITKDSLNLRQKLAELERPIGINGQALMATDTPQQAFDLLGARNRNRVINGDMRIDQRNAGASVNSNGAFIVDRFQQLMSGGGVLTSQRSTTVPAGFTNSIFIQVTTADSSIAAGDYYLLRHTVEGFNTADLGWGAANALSVTLSFWVRSSVTGTFSGAVENAAETRSYPFTYAISSVNTWEKKTITIPGDTSGTWATDNTVGIYLNLDLGSGSTFQGTASAWGSAKAFAATGAVQLISTLNATFYITGVQLEVGKVATPFEYRNYAQELALCQRYYEKSFEDTTVPANGPNGSSFSTEVGLTIGWAGHRSNYPTNGYPGRSTFARFRVPKRVPPTVSLYGNSGGFPYIYDTTNGARWVTTGWGSVSNKEGFEWVNEYSGTFQMFAFSHWTASAEL
jgi:hypothetical protein